MKTSCRLVSVTAFLFLTMGVSALPAQNASSVLPDIDGTKSQSNPNVEKPDPLKRQLTDKEKRAQQKELRGDPVGDVIVIPETLVL